MIGLPEAWTSKPPYGATLDRAHPIADGLVGFWPLPEGAGIPRDAVSGAAATANAMTWAGSPQGTVLTPNGGNNALQVSVPAGSPLDVVGAAISFGAWVHPTVSNAYQVVMSKDTGGAANQRQYSMFLSSSGTSDIFVSLGSGATGSYQGNIVLSVPWAVNAWNHVLCTYDGATIRIYIDGRPSGSQACTAPVITDSVASLWMGYDGGFASFPLKGWLDMPAVWERCLSAGEALAVGSGPAGLWQLLAPGPLRTWTFFSAARAYMPWIFGDQIEANALG